MKDLRDAFFDEIARFACDNHDVVILTNDMQVNSLVKFQKNQRSRFVNVGVAEQNTINIAAGIASTGKKVIVFGILSFITTRCYEQLKINICELNLPVLIVGIGSGLAFSLDGSTHHSTSDISLIRQLPNVQIYNPITAASAEEVAKEVLKFQMPTVVRLDKGTFIDQTHVASHVSATTLASSSKSEDVIFFTGPILEVIQQLMEAEDIDFKKFRFIGLNRVWPIPNEVLDLLVDLDSAWVFEENYISGGIYNALIEYAAFHELSVRFKLVGLLDHGTTLYGDRNWLRRQLGMKL